MNIQTMKERKNLLAVALASTAFIFVLFVSSMPAVFATSSGTASTPSGGSPCVKNVCPEFGIGVWKTAVDFAKNSYSFTQTSTGSCQAFKGDITKSSYLKNLPWPLSGKQCESAGKDTFSFTIIDPKLGHNNGCDVQVAGSFNSPTSATGTWKNFGLSACTAHGKYTITSTGKASSAIITFTGGVLGQAS